MRQPPRRPDLRWGLSGCDGWSGDLAVCLVSPEAQAEALTRSPSGSTPRPTPATRCTPTGQSGRTGGRCARPKPRRERQGCVRAPRGRTAGSHPDTRTTSTPGGRAGEPALTGGGRGVSGTGEESLHGRRTIDDAFYEWLPSWRSCLPSWPSQPAERCGSRQRRAARQQHARPAGRSPARCIAGPLDIVGERTRLLRRAVRAPQRAWLRGRRYGHGCQARGRASGHLPRRPRRPRSGINGRLETRHGHAVGWPRGRGKRWNPRSS